MCMQHIVILSSLCKWKRPKCFFLLNGTQYARPKNGGTQYARLKYGGTQYARGEGGVTLSFVIWCFQSRAGISCWNHALAKHSNIVVRRFIHSYMKVVRRSLLSLFTITLRYMSFQSWAGISCWNHALAQHSNLVKRSFILRIWKL